MVVTFGTVVTVLDEDDAARVVSFAVDVVATVVWLVVDVYLAGMVVLGVVGDVRVEVGILFAGLAEGRLSTKAAISPTKAKNTNSRIGKTTLLARFDSTCGVTVTFSINDLMQYGQKLASPFSSAPQNGHGFMFDHPSTFSPYSYKRALISSTESFLQMPKITTQSNSFLAYNAA